MAYKTLKEARKLVKQRGPHGDLLDTFDLAVRWNMDPETIAGYRYEGRTSKDGNPRVGPRYITLGDYSRAPVRYRLKDVEEYENRSRAKC